MSIDVVVAITFTLFISCDKSAWAMETKVAVDDKRIPFGVGYAKSSRAFCKGCKSTIGEDSLRMSVREPSRFFDGMQDNWFHYTCFWKRLKPGKTEINERSIRGMDMLKWDDQEKIREKIQAFMNYSSGGPVMESSFSTVKVEYAKTNRLRILCYCYNVAMYCYSQNELESVEDKIRKSEDRTQKNT
ncbi:hypothetical protein Aduo_014622 [Ancylostoma duodenale]